MTKDYLKRITRLEAAHGLSRRDMKREYAEARAEVNGQIERLERSVRESGDYAHRDSASFMENLVRAWLRDDRETAERMEAQLKADLEARAKGTHLPWKGFRP